MKYSVSINQTNFYIVSNFNNYIVFFYKKIDLLKVGQNINI